MGRHSFLWSQIKALPGVHVDAPRRVVVQACRGRLVYLASPYSKRAAHADGCYCPTEATRAAFDAAKWAAALAREGITAISPIAQAQAMADADMGAGLDPLDDRFWTDWCAPLLGACEALILPPIHGWQESRGCRLEITVAQNCGKPVFLMTGEGA
ncbi:DUF1937 family protein [Salipiger abyssi]|uniref:Putative DUF1937 protein n=1 Tax=Salipiger abyssi TaxID=1250539 RepID=A0A1P8UWF5_9RHOB|nr:DUF1937 family protein [Salipiger abyssi]APZ53724.1 putative DUF1937 protein [Salipiger abyssi]